MCKIRNSNSFITEYTFPNTLKIYRFQLYCTSYFKDHVLYDDKSVH